ncbi:hypothetical protein RB594_009640, partial [Gaeumannomyces avenae]
FFFQQLAEDSFLLCRRLTRPQFFITSGILYVLSLCFTKLSSVLVLYRLATTHRSIQYLLAVAGSVIFIWSAVACSIVVLQCRPLSILWGETPLSEGTCVSPNVLSDLCISIAAMDITSAFMFAGLPVFLLYRVQLASNTKISVILLLSLGTLTSITTVLRMKCVLDIAALASTHDNKAEDLYVKIYAYTIPEIGLALFTAAIVALPPLIKLLFQGGLESSRGSKSRGAPRTRASGEPGISLYRRTGRSDELWASSEENIISDGGATERGNHEARCQNA